jgi:hypothetical protein
VMPSGPWMTASASMIIDVLSRDAARRHEVPAGIGRAEEDGRGLKRGRPPRAFQ